MLTDVVTSVKCHQFARTWFFRADSAEVSHSSEPVFYSKKCMCSSPKAIPSVWKWKIFKLYFFTCFFPPMQEGSVSRLVKAPAWQTEDPRLQFAEALSAGFVTLKQLVLLLLRTVWRLYSWWNLSYSIVIWHGRLKAWCLLYRCLHFQKVAVIEIFKEETERLHGIRKDLHEKTHSSQLMTGAP